MSVSQPLVPPAVLCKHYLMCLSKSFSDLNACTLLGVWWRWCPLVCLFPLLMCLIVTLSERHTHLHAAHQPCTDAVQDKCNSVPHHKLSASLKCLGLRQKTKGRVEHSKPSASPVLPVPHTAWGHWAGQGTLHWPSMKIKPCRQKCVLGPTVGTRETQAGYTGLLYVRLHGSAYNCHEFLAVSHWQRSSNEMKTHVVFLCDHLWLLELNIEKLLALKWMGIWDCLTLNVRNADMHSVESCPMANSWAQVETCLMNSREYWYAL